MNEKELKREATILAAKLQKQNKWLEKYRPFHGAPLIWIVVGIKTRNKKKAMTVPADLARFMLAQGYLVTDPMGSLRPGIQNAKGSDEARFADQHRLTVERVVTHDDKIPTAVKFNEAETPLGWLRARRDKSGNPLISQHQFDAGERLRADFTCAQLAARTTINWDFANVGASRGKRSAQTAADLSDTAIAAKKRFFVALDDLGEDMAQIVLNVCCLESGLEAAERQLGWPRRSGKLVLQMALTRLARHYGLIPPDQQSTNYAKIMQWGAPGYRPHIPPATP